MKIVEQSEISYLQKSRIVEIWNAEYPASIAYSNLKGFEDYLNNFQTKRHFLAYGEADEIVGWALIFDRDEAMWFAILIDAKVQGKGLGMKMIETLKAAEKRLFGWVIDNNEALKSSGQPYHSPLDFYRRLGFKIHADEKIVKQGISGVKIEWNPE